MNHLDELVNRIKVQHFAYPPSSPSDIEHLHRAGLPSDVLEFFRAADGACLHRMSPSGGLRKEGDSWWRWVVLRSRSVKSVQELGYIQPQSPHFERSRFWLALVDVQDGNYLALSVEPGHEGEVIDCFHETIGVPGYSSIVAKSFTELLELLLSKPSPFWLEKDCRQYGAY